jgi:outer membrane protein assembly factor BamB
LRRKGLVDHPGDPAIRMDMRFSGITLSCLALSATSLLHAGDWPRWRGPDLTGISRERITWSSAEPTTLWKAEVGIGFSAVSIADGRAFTIGNKDATDTVYCFDAVTGKELWKYSYPCPLDAKYYEGGPGSTPTVDGAKVYTLSKRGQIFCLDAATGKKDWEKNLMEELGVKKPEWGFAGSPLVKGKLLLLNLGEAGTALDKTTGKVKWTSGKDASGYATPVPYVASGEACIALFSGKALVGVRVQDGKEQWRYPWVERWSINAAEPILVDGNKWFISTFGKGCALLEMQGLAEPKVLWENKNMGNHFNGCLYLDGCFFGHHGNTDQPEKELRCLDAKTGAIRWQQKGFGLGSLTAAKNKLLILSDRGELTLAAANPGKFERLAQAQVLGGKCWTVPVLANGRVYLRNAQGTVVCLGLK